MFDVAAEKYDRFMGRYSVPLAPQLVELAGIAPGQRVLDVGCGPGALTSALVERVGAENVSAVDPSAPFVDAARERYPGVDVREASAEHLPYADDEFDATLAQLVVHFMADPLQGVREMARVTRPGGVVAASVWDHGGGRGPLSPFWAAARRFDPGLTGESNLMGSRQGQLVELFREAGVRDVEESALCVEVRHPSFDEWWEPFTFGLGPVGVYMGRLDPEHQAQIREGSRDELPDDLVVTVYAWVARGVA